MQTSLRGIANKAAEQKQYRFRDLYRLLNEENLRESFYLLRKKAACGVDGVTFQEYEKKLDENLVDLVGRLKAKRYRAKLVKRKYIPKPGSDKGRPLGIPALEDKILQAAVANILSAIYGQDFLDCSYGYRKGLGPHDALDDLQESLQSGGHHWVVEADIRGFFDNMDHEWLVRMLEQRVDDRALIRLIKKWLRAGILEEDGSVVHPETGSPQGGIVSPVLSNIYLHYALDLWFEKEVAKSCLGSCKLVRYADDFVCAFASRSEAEAFEAQLKERLAKFGLEVAEDKTQTLKFTKRGGKGNGKFDFLGFEFRWGPSRKGNLVVKRRTSRKKFRASLRNFTEWIRTHRHQKARILLEQFKRKIDGYGNYYAIVGNSRSVNDLFRLLRKLLFKWLNRRSDKRSYVWPSFNRLLKRHGISCPKVKRTGDLQLELGLNVVVL